MWCLHLLHVLKIPFYLWSVSLMFCKSMLASLWYRWYIICDWILKLPQPINWFVCRVILKVCDYLLPVPLNSVKTWGVWFVPLWCWGVSNDWEGLFRWQLLIDSSSVSTPLATVSTNCLLTALRHSRKTARFSCFLSACVGLFCMPDLACFSRPSLKLLLKYSLHILSSSSRASLTNSFSFNLLTSCTSKWSNDLGSNRGIWHS